MNFESKSNKQDQQAWKIIELLDIKYFIEKNFKETEISTYTPRDLIARIAHVAKNENIVINRYLDPEYYINKNTINNRDMSYVFDILECQGPNFPNPHPLFNCEYYISQLPKNSSIEQHPIFHFLKTFDSESRICPHPFLKYCEASLTKPGGSLKQVHAEETRATLNNLRESLTEARNSDSYGSTFSEISIQFLLDRYGLEVNGTFFDVGFYKETYRDVVDAGIDPLIHYILHGRAEGRHPNRHVGKGYSKDSVVPRHNHDWKTAVLTVWSQLSKSSGLQWLPTPWQQVSRGVVCALSPGPDDLVRLLPWDQFVEFNCGNASDISDQRVTVGDLTLRIFGAPDDTPDGRYVLLVKSSDGRFVTRPVNLSSTSSLVPWELFEALASSGGEERLLRDDDENAVPDGVVAIVHGYFSKPDSATLASLEMLTVTPVKTLLWRYGEPMPKVSDNSTAWVLFVENGSILRPNALAELTRLLSEDPEIEVLCWQSLAVADVNQGHLVPKPVPMWSKSLIEAGGGLNGSALVASQPLGQLTEVTCFYDVILQLDLDAPKGKVTNSYLSIQGTKNGWMDTQRLALEQTAIAEHFQRNKQSINTSDWKISGHGDLIWSLGGNTLEQDQVSIFAVSMTPFANTRLANQDAIAKAVSGLISRTSHKAADFSVLAPVSSGLNPLVLHVELHQFREDSYGYGIVGAVKEAVMSAKGQYVAFVNLDYQAYTPAWLQRLARHLEGPDNGAAIGIGYEQHPGALPRVTLAAEIVNDQPDNGLPPAVASFLLSPSERAARKPRMPCLMAKRTVLQDILQGAQTGSPLEPGFWIDLFKTNGRRVLMDTSVAFQSVRSVSIDDMEPGPPTRHGDPLWAGKYVDVNLPTLTLY